MNIVIPIVIAGLHVLMSLTILIYHGILAENQVVSTISRAIEESNFKDKDIQNMKASFEAKVGSTSHLALALSLPFGPILRPLHEKWIDQPVLNHEIGEYEFKQRTRIIGVVQLLSNGLFFGFVILYIWKLVFYL